MSTRIALALLIAALIVPAAAAASEDGPMRGRCIAVRGTTGVSVTIANCLPNMPDVADVLDEAVCGLTDCHLALR